MNIYYVYILLDPRNDQPFYIGKGKKKRAYSHLNETKDNTLNMRKFNKIQSIRTSGKEPIVSFFEENLSEDEAYNLEEKLIERFGRIGYDDDGILTNLCKNARPPGNDNFKTNNPGLKLKGKTYNELYGEEKANELKLKRSVSSNGRTFSDETRKKMSESAKRRIENGYVMPSNKGKTFSDETRKRMSDSKKGIPTRPHTEETKKKISESNKGKQRRPKTEEEKNKIRESQLNSEKFRNRKGYLKIRKRVLYEGKIFESIKDLIDFLPMSKNTFYRYVKDGKICYTVLDKDDNGET